MQTDICLLFNDNRCQGKLCPNHRVHACYVCKREHKCCVAHPQDWQALQLQLLKKTGDDRVPPGPAPASLAKLRLPKPHPTNQSLDDLMERAREQAARGKASRYIPERKPPNGKTPNMDKLYNSLVSLLQVQLVSFPSTAAGEKFTKALTNTLFYIDGHQRTINKRFPNPSIFLQYQG